MSIIAFYAYQDKMFTPIPSGLVHKIMGEISNPGAICTVERRMFIDPRNTSFSIKEIQKIVQYVEALKLVQNEDKSSD